MPFRRLGQSAQQCKVESASVLFLLGTNTRNQPEGIENQMWDCDYVFTFSVPFLFLLSSFLIIWICRSFRSSFLFRQPKKDAK